MMKRAAAILSLVLICGLAGFAGGLLANFYRSIPTLTGPPEGVVKAKRFQVIDDRGRVAAELSPFGLDLLGQDGRVRATLRLLYNDKGVLAFSDAKWEGRALFGFLGTDTPSMKDDDWGLQIYGPDRWNPVASLSAVGNGTRGLLSVASEKGNRVIDAPEH
jgi:hypothetical protein